MATSSIFHNVKIKDKKLCGGLVRALETSYENKGKEVILSQRCQSVKAADIKDFFFSTTKEK